MTFSGSTQSDVNSSPALSLACSVVVATYNRSQLLLRLLASLERQDVPATSFEVIVVDDGSRDDTQSVLSRYEPPFRLVKLRQENQGPAARNRAIAAAGAELIISLDDDVIAMPDLLRRHIEAHARKDNLAVIGPMLPPPGERLAPWLQWEAVTLNKQYDEMSRGDWRPTPRQFYTGNASFGRRQAIDAGLFDPTFKRAEDVEFAFRLEDKGCAFSFLPEAIVHHQPNRSYREWLKVPALYGYYDVVIARDKGRAWLLARVGQEFNARQRTVRFVAQHLIGRKRFVDAFVRLAGVTAAAGSRFRIPRVSRAAYSAVFNLQYWQGLCEALGSREAYLALISPRSAESTRIEAVGT